MYSKTKARFGHFPAFQALQTRQPDALLHMFMLSV